MTMNKEILDPKKSGEKGEEREREREMATGLQINFLMVHVI